MRDNENFGFESLYKIQKLDSEPSSEMYVRECKEIAFRNLGICDASIFALTFLLRAETHLNRCFDVE